MLLPSRWGWCLTLCADPFQTGAILSMGEWAPDETHILNRLVQPGATVLDIGANIGSITLALAAAVGQTGRIIAFEPQRYPYLCLCANVALNSLGHFVQPVKAAVGEHEGSIAVPLLDPTVPTNFGGVSLLDAHTAQTETVPLVTIDSLNLDACHLIKADIEGMEAAALRGAKETINAFRPIIWAEQLDHKECSRGDLLSFFRDHNYCAWKLATKLFAPHNARGQRENMFVFQDGTPMEDHNVLALPVESDYPSWLDKIELFQ